MSLSADQPYGEAAAAIIGERSDAVFAHARRRVLDITDIEGVHEMRVATRRLRAALEVFGPCLHPKRGARALREVKALAAALGERRDRDVQLELLEQLHDECAGAEQRAVDLLAGELRAEQQQVNVELAEALAHAKRTRLRRRLARLAR
ncbi:MAG TPA: CHAD domain-containing protein [Solirubrobacteraceae bacterium]|nr:CHAD domain-containing protein [Solirubrobacteraceae bacterium]